jgi:hypothetical protein
LRGPIAVDGTIAVDPLFNPPKLEEKKMPKYLIERELPGAGDLGDDQIQGI